MLSRSKIAAGASIPTATLQGAINAPSAIAIDSSGNLYVANTNYNTVSEFAPARWPNVAARSPVDTFQRIVSPSPPPGSVPLAARSRPCDAGTNAKFRAIISSGPRCLDGIPSAGHTITCGPTTQAIVPSGPKAVLIVVSGASFPRARPSNSSFMSVKPA